MPRRRSSSAPSSINPNFADAHANLGNVLLAQGRLDEAAQRYQRALALKPDLAGAHNNLGIVLAAQGQFEEASRRFQLGAGAQAGLHRRLQQSGARVHGAGAAGQRAGGVAARARVAETADTKSLFVQCVKFLAVPPDVEDFRALLIRGLSEPWGRTNDLAPVAARLSSRTERIDGCIARVRAGLAAAAPGA